MQRPRCRTILPVPGALHLSLFKLFSAVNDARGCPSAGLCDDFTGTGTNNGHNAILVNCGNTFIRTAPINGYVQSKRIRGGIQINRGANRLHKILDSSGAMHNSQRCYHRRRCRRRCGRSSGRGDSRGGHSAVRRRSGGTGNRFIYVAFYIDRNDCDYRNNDADEKNAANQHLPVHIFCLTASRIRPFDRCIRLRNRALNSRFFHPAMRATGTERRIGAVAPLTGSIWNKAHVTSPFYDIKLQWLHPVYMIQPDGPPVNQIMLKIF